MTHVLRGRGLRLAAVVLAAPLLAGCLPAAATAEGRSTSDLYRLFLGLGVVVAILVQGLATFAILRYRRRRDAPDELPRQVHGSDRLEIAWTAIPLLLVLGLFAATLGVLSRVEASTPGAVEIRVQAFRWGWDVTYPANGIHLTGLGPTGPEIVVPAGRPVRFTLTAADVIHAFFVPQFIFKRDAIPGRESSFEVTVSEPGVYRGQCAEFCGIGHSQMPFTVRAVPDAEFAAWLAAGGPAASGAGAPSLPAPSASAP